MLYGVNLCYDDQIKECRMDRCVGIGQRRNMCRSYWGNVKGRNYLADLEESGRVIMEWRIERGRGLFNDAFIC